MSEKQVFLDRVSQSQTAKVLSFSAFDAIPSLVTAQAARADEVISW